MQQWRAAAQQAAHATWLNCQPSQGAAPAASMPRCWVVNTSAGALYLAVWLQWLQAGLWEAHGVRTLRLTLAEIAARCSVRPSDGALLLDASTPVGLVYYRAGERPHAGGGVTLLVFDCAWAGGGGGAAACGGGCPPEPRPFLAATCTATCCCVSCQATRPPTTPAAVSGRPARSLNRRRQPSAPPPPTSWRVPRRCSRRWQHQACWSALSAHRKPSS